MLALAQMHSEWLEWSVGLEVVGGLFGFTRVTVTGLPGFTCKYLTAVRRFQRLVFSLLFFFAFPFRRTLFLSYASVGCCVGTLRDCVVSCVRAPLLNFSMLTCISHELNNETQESR